jgi:hypothetical protein
MPVEVSKIIRHIIEHFEQHSAVNVSITKSSNRITKVELSGPEYNLGNIRMYGSIYRNVISILCANIRSSYDGTIESRHKGSLKITSRAPDSSIGTFHIYSKKPVDGTDIDIATIISDMNLFLTSRGSLSAHNEKKYALFISDIDENDFFIFA